MKAIKCNKVMLVATLLFTTALFVVPEFAFADAQEESASDVSASSAEEGFSSSDDLISDAGGMGVDAVESGVAVVNSSDDGTAASPVWGEGVLTDVEPDAPSEGDGDGFEYGGFDSAGGIDVDAGDDGSSDSDAACGFGDVQVPDGDEVGEIGDDAGEEVDGDRGSADDATSENCVVGETLPDVEAEVVSNESESSADADVAPEASGSSADADVAPEASGSSADAEASGSSAGAGAGHNTGGMCVEEITVADANAQKNAAPDSDKDVAGAAVDGGASAVPVAAGDENPDPVEDERLLAQSESKSGVMLAPLEISIAKTLIEGALSGIASGTFSWSARQLMNDLFGGVVGDDTQKQLEEILKKLDEIEESINTLKANAERMQMQTILNDLKYLLGSTTTSTIYNALRDIDDDLARGRITSDKAEEARLKALTTDIGITEELWAAVNTDFDQYIDKLWMAMTGPYEVTVDDQRQKLTLMQTHYELLRRSYKWEHQSYDEWSSFQIRCVSLLMASLTLERASLQARIDLLVANNRKNEAYGVSERLELIEDWIKQAAGYKVVLPDGVKVIYPGYFSEKTWAAQYWMFKERDGSERYYWAPGHEIVFYAQVNTQHVPQENRDGGLDHQYSLWGVSWDGNLPYPKFKFWKPFIRYQGGNTLLASADQLTTVYKDYGGTKSLYDIFIGDGNFQGLEINGNTDWYFIVDPDDKHQLYYEPHFFKADRLICYSLSSANAAQSKVVLCYYHNQYTEPNRHTNYIGIGVKRVGPEIYDPSGNHQLPQPDPEFYTAVKYPDDWAQWWPSHGDLAVDYEGGTHGGVDRVFMDGELLDPSCYTVSDNGVVLSGEYMAGLGFGRHEIFLDTEGGGHTVAFATQADGDYYVASGEDSAWTQGAGDGLAFVFKRTADDQITIVRLVDVLVDGWSVPAWGYTARAGSAIVTLTSAFLNMLAPGIHTLTAVFEDGNDPQAAFTVRAASSAPQAVPVTYVGENVQPEGTPRTGDGTIFVMAFLALTALASAVVAVRAKRCA